MRERRAGLRCCVPARRASRAVSFWTAAALLVLVLAASGVPSPLYRVNQERFGFSAGVLTTVFGIYALALLATLLVVGALSDHVGRRPVIVAGMLLQVVAMALGARAVMIGRAYLWGMAATGERGVQNVLAIIRQGIDEALLGLGKASVHDLTREDVVLPPHFTRD